MILLIETSGKNCSLALLDELTEELTAVEGNIEFGNSEQIVVLTQQLLSQKNIEIKELKAIALSSGPGSYTGLRIGTSFAKGICFAAKIPLIEVNTLESFRALAISKFPKTQLIFSNLMAIKTEAYVSVFCDKKEFEFYNEPIELSTFDFAKYAGLNCCFVGNAIHKIKEYLPIDLHCEFIETQPHVAYLKEIVMEKFNKKEFVSVSAFEPNYIKQFNAGISKKFSLT